MLTLHIVAGLLALLGGALALAATKGSPLHRGAGRVFAGAMLVMTGSAVVMAAFLRPNLGNVLAGSLTAYMVITGVLAVARPVARVRAVLAGLMCVAAAVGAAGFWFGAEAMALPNRAIDQIPFAAYFMFGAVGSLGALLDARLLWRGRLEGKHRTARHLWRMGFAMWIATMSFFLGQADEFPAALRASGVLALPVLAVTLTVLYWVVRVPFARQPLALNPYAARRARPASRGAAQLPEGARP